MLTKLSADPPLSANFAPTNYVPGDPLRTLLEIAGEGIADVERMVQALGLGGYLQTAGGEWLDALVESHYALGRQPSTFLRGAVRLTAAQDSGATAPPGLIVGTASGLKYQTLAAVNIPAGGYTDVPVQAESPGAHYNVPAGTLTVLHTPLPGLSVTNLPGWIAEAGADTESDDALRRRASLRWAELGGGATRAAYEYWAYTAHPAVDRVTVLDEHPRGQGTVDVLIWGSGGIGDEVVTAVDNYIQPRRPLTADVLVYSATERLVPLTVDLYAPGADQAGIEAQVHAGLAGLQRETSIGGTLYAAQITEVAMLPAGMLDARLSTGDIVLRPTEALTLQPTLSWRYTP